MSDLLIRFAIGGLVVTLFSALGDILRPRRFAGLLSAAPSVALAALGLTVSHEGRFYAATEARSMIVGAAAFVIYASAVSWAIMRFKRSALAITVLLMPVWFTAALGLWFLLLKGRA